MFGSQEELFLREKAKRTVLSACYRAVEGSLFDLTMRYFFEAESGGQMVLPIYDGGILAAPGDRVEEVVGAITEAANRAWRGQGMPSGSNVLKVTF